ncbi:MAG: prepilin-type N-terminal cleavage/methylation domain-containing protein [Planctomycetes bacterium]|nr:prepilin-type N-terminal cleavage/methylation domain-containing protein [Planctomycetota bacterium]
MSKRRRACAERRGGFTLLEVAASVAILGIVLATLLVAHGRSIQSYRVAAETMTAAHVCASQAAELRAHIIGEGTGECFARNARYRWRIALAQLPEDAPEGLEAFTIRVSPPSGDAESSVAVTLWLRTAMLSGVGQP